MFNCRYGDMQAKDKSKIDKKGLSKEGKKARMVKYMKKILVDLTKNISNSEKKQ